MSSPASGLRAIVESDTLHRVLRTRKHSDDLHEAFMLRAVEKDSGLSVNYDCTADEARMQLHFDITYGVASLLASSATSLNLKVVPNEAKHANITGIPYKEDDEAQAEWIASQLAKRVTDVIRDVWKRPKSTSTTPAT